MKSLRAAAKVGGRSEVGPRGGVGVGVGHHRVLVGVGLHEDGKGFVFCAAAKEGCVVADSDVIPLF